jgi:glycosyltransferase involved in cell wall biosynthesis
MNIQRRNDTPAWAKAPRKGERKPTLLFIDHAVPQYDLYAGSRTNFMYLEMLVEMGLEVKFLCADFQRVEPYSTELNHLGIETLDGEWYRDNWQSWLRENGQGIDYVFFHKPEPATTFLTAVKSFTNAAIIYQCHDLHYLRLRRKAGVENDQAIFEEADLYEKKEDFIFAGSDVLLTFSDVEEKVIKGKFPHKKVFIVPLFFYRDVRKPDRDFSKRHDLLFVGACAHTPNRDAIAWFCSEVFPRIQQQIPAIILNVVGANPPADIASLHSESIKILGRVSEEELQALYENVRMMVVPLRFGAGVKGKIIETLYHGTPFVSTTIGLEGIKGIDQLVPAKDSPEDFAAAVVSLYTAEDKLQELSRRGLQLVADNFTLQKTAELMTAVLSASKNEAALRLAEAIGDATRQKPPRLIAFYLPQYHPIPENDEWWGQGFTEWRNVSKAEPLFSGHYQPHVPAELGFYDLRQQETRIAQADLAKKYGIEGFCYYHYWFNGRRLLERPLADLIKSGKPDFPFCVCWANESWTRRWDGTGQEVLMRQEYSEEDDHHHIQSLLPMFRDKRYIRVNGKPLFLVYRTENVPNPVRTAKIWREEARKAGVGELYLCRVESFAKHDPTDINFDAAVEFAPDWWNKGPQLKADSALLSQAEMDLSEVCDNNFVHTYQGLAESMMAKEAPDYKWFRCVTPAWDNWARRQQGASIFLDSTPQKYQAWLASAVDNTNGRLLGEERMVFVNAWNEWAEGNHLEPDQKFGHAYLEATQRALQEGQLATDVRRVGASDDMRMNRLMNQLAHHKYQLNELEGQIEELLNSTSWRATVPLRWTKQQLLNLKKLLKPRE